MDSELADLPIITPAQVERLADAAFLTDADGTITVWNTAATDLLGHPATRAVGGQCALLLEGVRMHGRPVCTPTCLLLQGLFPRSEFGIGFHIEAARCSDGMKALGN